MSKLSQTFLLAITTIWLLHTSANSYFFVPVNGTDANGCGVGEEFRAGACKLCRPGTYRFIPPKGVPTGKQFQCLTLIESYGGRFPPLTPNCVKCPAGTYNPFAGVVSPLGCIACPAGSTSKAGSGKCRQCPRQRSSASGSPACGNCGKGTFLTKPCAYGQRPKNLCSKCPQGSYSTKRNSLECMKCPDGSSTATAGASSKAMCKPCGSSGVRCSCRSSNEPWNAVSSYRPVGNSNCIRCPPGSRATNPFATSAKQCIPCAEDSVYIFREGCRKCAKGMKTFGPGAGGCRTKKEDKCPYGLFKSKDGVCISCPPGYKRMGNQCILCPAGTTTSSNGKSCDKCNFPEVAYDSRTSACGCTRNYFRDYEKTYKCLPCPKGTKVDYDIHGQDYCDVDCDAVPNHPSCKPCKKNFERDNKTQVCSRCPKGTFSLRGRERCVLPRTGCPVGTFFGVVPGRFGYSYTCDSTGRTLPN